MKKWLKALMIIILAASSLMPFSVYASGETGISPTYSSSAQTWVTNNGQVSISNYCEGTTASTNSCRLSFDLNDDWYGSIYFTGKNSSDTTYIDYKTVHIAGGHGEYYYNFWANGQIQISKVNVDMINLVKPDSNVDLSQIISLLTDIESDTSSLTITESNVLAQIRNVLNELIESNGYLEQIAKLRNYTFPIESFSAISTAMGTLPIVDYFEYYNYVYPIFSITQNDILFNINVSTNGDIYLVYFLSGRITTDTMSRYLEWSEGYTIKEYSFIRSGTYNGRNGTFYRVVISWDSGGFKTLKFIGSSTYDFIPIYAYGNNGYVSTEFALLWGLDNRLLDDLDIIANGTQQSQGAASDLEDNNDQMASDMQNMATVENQYNHDLNNQLNNIDFTSPIQQNAGILPAATFVISIFNGLINNNPLSMLIIVCCILLIGKKVIGK